jgi:outer membrane protein OmpA-like peptidoglycan-associated protein
MKKVFNSLFVLVLSVFAFPALAQEESSLSEIALRKAYRDNWYISVGPSVNVLFAEQDKLLSPVDRMRFGGEISVGKWLSPYTGISLNIAGGGLCGFNQLSAPYETGYYTDSKDRHYDMHDPYFKYGRPLGGFIYDEATGKLNTKYKYTTGKNGEKGFLQDFNYMVYTIDIMGNMSNLFRGRPEERSWFDLVGFVGLGVNHAFGNKITTPSFWFAAGRVGLRANFNFTRNIGIYLEAAGYATDPEFDGYKGTTMGDLYTSLSVGAHYTFNKRISTFEKVAIDQLDRLNRRVNENRDLIENHQDILERQQKLIDKLGSNLSSQTEKTVPVIHRETSRSLPEYVRFALDSYRIDRSEYSKIQDVVDFLKNNPGSKVLLVGYADKLTGGSVYNYNLSKKRVDAVKAELQRLGIAESRLFVEWKGDKEQPFSTNEWNRVVIMVERK